MTHPDLADEQRYFDGLYARLEGDIAHTERRLEEVRLQEIGGLHQARYERDVFAGHLEDRLEMLRSHRRDDLCFGRIDMADGRRLYVGRLGLSDDENETLLVDWRAPAAAPFYQATPLEPQGVVRRRHFMTRQRQVVAVEDEVLDAESISAEEARTLRGEAALTYAMNSARTGRMREIAATIQKEQDEIIRAPLTPAVFVQGGPGTGKTAVALHRAAYLLYTHRRRLTAAEMLVIGPNPLFLRYIENVLPSLGETGADLTAVPQVYSRREWAEESEPARTIKARLDMVEVVTRAVATRQRPLRRTMEIAVDGHVARITPADTRHIVENARRRKGRHNDHVTYVRGRLVRLAWRRVRKSVGDSMEYADYRRAVRGNRQFKEISRRVWPLLTPERLLNDLFGFPALLEAAAGGVLSSREIEALRRPWQADVGDVVWTDADAPVLDEAARQLGPVPPELDPAARRRAASAEDEDDARAEAYYRRQLLSGLGGGMVSRDMLEERVSGGRSGSDDDDEIDEGRHWRYAVIDEAQDLSPMAWRMIARHAPRRAMTVVGDLAQGTQPWSPASWDEVRATLGAPEAKVAELTVNYRTPQEVADYAASLLERLDVPLTPPVSIRSVPGSFSTAEVAAEDVVLTAVEAAAGLHGELGEGIAAVLAPPAMLESVLDELAARLGRPVPSPHDPRVLDAPVIAMTPTLAKGLEFDVVVVADPDAVVAAEGWRALYVSATRATRRLHVVTAL